MKVPLLDLGAQYAQVGEAVEAAVRRVLPTGHYILGPEVAALEKELAAFVGTEYAVGVSSGSDALLCSLMALDLKPGDEVITTPFSFFATAGAIARLHARPVFADVDEESLNLDAADALRRQSDRTRAFLPVHLFGRLANLAPLLAAGPPVIEDAAQALGTAGVAHRQSKAATLSFFPSKNLGAAGDGGMVLTHDAGFAEQVRLLRTHGSKPKYVHQVLGGNFRLDPLQAAILRAKLPFLKSWNAKRQQNANRYRQLLKPQPLRLPPEGDFNWHHFVVRSDRRDSLRQWLKQREIETEVYYPEPLHLQPCLSQLGYRLGDLPVAEQACKEVLALPVHPELTEAQIEHVAASVIGFFA